MTDDAAGVEPARPAAATRDGRRPRRVFSVGDEPDARFTLANERTLLAWVRTSLALVVAGLAAAVAADVVDDPTVLTVVSLVSVTLAAFVAVSSYLRWGRMERAMRLGLPLPAPTSAVVVVGGVLVLAAVALFALSRA